MCHLGQMLNGETNLIEVTASPNTFDTSGIKNVLGMEMKDAVQSAKDMANHLGI